MLKLDTIDSTNNYAMQLIDADKAAHGLTVLADRQTAGRGQRGRTWEDSPGNSLLMSTILRPVYSLQEQPLFLAATATAIAEYLREIIPEQPVWIKWPNDIVLNDKKAGGILIENAVRGALWQWAVIGFGLNLNQHLFPNTLLRATSLLLTTGRTFHAEALASQIRERLGALVREPADAIMEKYNELLYRKGKFQYFRAGERVWCGQICGVNSNGQITVRLHDGSLQHYAHGSVDWVWH